MIDKIKFITLGNTVFIDIILDIECIHYDEELNVDKDSIFVIGCFTELEKLKLIEPHLESGMKFIFDLAWECDIPKSTVEFLKKYSANALTIATFDHTDDKNCVIGKKLFIPMYFWYNEFLYYKRHKTIIRCAPIATNTNFLMPIGNWIEVRKKFVELLDDRINNSVYSQVELGKRLPEDFEPLDRRYNNPNWYANTGYSMVLESVFSSNCDLISEKTFKPIMNGHPFLVLTRPGALKILQKHGFKTFNGIINESYDQELDLDKRMRMIIEEIDAITLEKLHATREIVLHNYNQFFNEQLIMKNIDRDVRIPLEKFCFE